ncbi:DUF2267 domain-containing protein [Chroococcidiopsis sp. TS-821]|uniref:DUF2267 domain-containing protein n=1 Tax=Chroococcidiopsis sp. TS-821 TaxID=1378066 RepID=UPI000CEED1D8|nr:DUF2267 domain-containing protein [Chroococcidiopsis sp. TS-821]PPS42271.1 hypothetical protein B1A85_14655 [Chroococcidiopsis sp. TS-821]
MSMTGLSVFDTTLQQTNVWLNDVAQEYGSDDKHLVFQGMRMTLQALRDRLIVDEAAHLGAQLPILLSGFYYENWRPSTNPSKERKKEEFLNSVRNRLQKVNPNIDIERMVRAVFRVLAMRVSTGEIEDITSILPPELKELWPESVRT